MKKKHCLHARVRFPSDAQLISQKRGFSDKYLSQLLAVSEDDVRNRRIELGVEEAWEGIHVSGTKGQRILLLYL